KVDKVGMLTDVASPYSVGLAAYFKEPFVANGGTIVAEQKYSGGDKDFKAQLTAIKAANPQAIVVPGYYTEAALIAQQARQLGITVPLFGGDGWEAPELLQIGGQAMEGTYYSTHYSSENEAPVVQDFVKKFKAKFNGETPTPWLLWDMIRRWFWRMPSSGRERPTAPSCGTRSPRRKIIPESPATRLWTPTATPPN